MFLMLGLKHCETRLDPILKLIKKAVNLAHYQTEINNYILCFLGHDPVYYSGRLISIWETTRPPFQGRGQQVLQRFLLSSLSAEVTVFCTEQLNMHKTA